MRKRLAMVVASATLCAPLTATLILSEPSATATSCVRTPSVKRLERRMAALQAEVRKARKAGHHAKAARMRVRLHRAKSALRAQCPLPPPR